MTTYEQELMLFGGWAKAQIPQPIGSGLYVNSVTVSASIYTDLLIKTGRDVETKDFTFNINEINLPYLLNEFYYHPNIEIYRYSYNKATQQYMWEGEPIGFIIYWWKDRAFLRFFEIWEAGSSSTFMRGLKGTERLRRSFAGKVGSQSTGRIPKVVRIDGKAWKIGNKQALYPQIKHLSLSGIQAARTLARQLQKQRYVRDVRQ